MERNRIIRMNKEYKNKKEAIKLGKLTEAFQIRKSQQKQVKSLVQKRL